MKPNQRKFLQLFFGNKKAQSFFSKLHRFALYGQYYALEHLWKAAVSGMYSHY